jgi:hypothetical protein
MKSKMAFAIILSAVAMYATAADENVLGKYTGSFAGPGNLVGVVVYIDEIALNGEIKGRMQYSARRGANTCPTTGTLENGNQLKVTTQPAGTLCDDSTINGLVSNGKIKGTISYKGSEVSLQLSK